MSSRTKYRYNLDVPPDLSEALNSRAAFRGVSQANLIRKLIRVGLTFEQADANPNSHFIIREDGKPDREVIWA